jgi:hypothetical protein
MNTTFEIAYLSMLAADAAGEPASISAAVDALRATDLTGSGTGAQRNRALISGCNPLTPSERNAALVGRRVGS